MTTSIYTDPDLRIQVVKDAANEAAERAANAASESMNRALTTAGSPAYGNFGFQDSFERQVFRDQMRERFRELVAEF